MPRSGGARLAGRGVTCSRVAVSAAAAPRVRLGSVQIRGTKRWARPMHVRGNTIKRRVTNPLVSKRANKNYYKGRGAPASKIGAFTKHGKFYVIQSKLDKVLF